MESMLDKHGESWRQWVLDNLERRCEPGGMFDRMVQAVWTHDDAAQALDQGLAQLGLPAEWRATLPAIAPGDVVDALGQPVKVLARLDRPRAVLLDNVLGAQECEALIRYATDKGLKASGVVDRDTGESVAHQARTSSSVFFTRAETPLIAAIEQRLAALTGWPVANGEGLQVLRYEPGQQYKPHHDWFNPDNPGSAGHLQRGGQRVGTTVIYLSPAQSGGGTRFPKTGLEVLPRTGGAIFFANLDVAGRPDDLSLHAGTPVLEGTKVVMTYWQRERAFGPSEHVSPPGGGVR